MKIKGYEPNKSSFLSIDKDMSIIIDKILENSNLKKLLFYSVPDALSKPDLNEDETLSLINKNIKIVPKLIVDKSVLSYIIISFDNFVESSNPEFRDNTISFDILCHFDQWIIKDSRLRPFRIAAELDNMFNDARFSGIGKLEFLGANRLTINSEFAGLTLIYKAIHGDEDKTHPLNPTEEL